MGSHNEQDAHDEYDDHDARTCRCVSLIQIIMFALAAAAVAKELRTAPAQRTWNGLVAGFVPYDFRVPTFERIKSRVWAPDSTRLIGPRVFGVGWTLNVGRVVALFKEAFDRAR